MYGCTRACIYICSSRLLTLCQGFAIKTEKGNVHGGDGEKHESRAKMRRLSRSRSGFLMSKNLFQLPERDFSQVVSIPLPALDGLLSMGILQSRRWVDSHNFTQPSWKLDRFCVCVFVCVANTASSGQERELSIILGVWGARRGTTKPRPCKNTQHLEKKAKLRGEFAMFRKASRCFSEDAVGLQMTQADKSREILFSLHYHLKMKAQAPPV